MGSETRAKIEACVNGKEEKIFGWNTKATGIEYKHFLRQFAFALKSFLRKENLEDNVLVHVSDEPPFSCLMSYKKASRIIHHLFPEYKIIDAMSSYPLAKICNVRYPIPANDYIDSFIGKTEELWTYYCSAQSSKNVSNRFFQCRLSGTEFSVTKCTNTQSKDFFTGATIFTSASIPENLLTHTR